MESTPEIFFSYAWDDENEPGNSREKIVNELYESLIADGYPVIRDKNDLRYKGLISDLTRRIGRGKLIIVAISDKYLKSANCMSELLEIYRRSNSDIGEMLAKIFPIVLDDAKIHTPEDRIEYLRFWETKKEALNTTIRGVGLENAASFAEDLRFYDEITSVIPVLSRLLKDINTLDPQSLSANNFEEIKKAIIRTVSVAQAPVQDHSINNPATGMPFMKMPGWRAVVFILVASILPGSTLYFGHVSTTGIRLELSISEINFTLPEQQVLTNVMKLSSIGASGLRNVQLPAAINNISLQQPVSDGARSAVLLSLDSNGTPSGTITFDALSFQAGMRIGLQTTDVNGVYRLTLYGHELNLPVQVNGLVNIALPPSIPEPVNLSSPGIINLQSGKDEVDLDLDFLPGSKSILPGVILADSISLLRIDENFDEDISIVRTVSTILSGTLYYESLHGQERRLLPGQQIRFTKSQGQISALELQGDHIVFTFLGRVSGMTTGDRNKPVSLMPTYSDWLLARLGPALFVGIVLIIFILTIAAMSWRRASI